MVQRHHVHGYEAFLALIKNLSSERINVLFTGTKENGVSWCPDCVEAEPFIEKAVETAPPTSHYIVVEVGNRTL